MCDKENNKKRSPEELANMINQALRSPQVTKEVRPIVDEQGLIKITFEVNGEIFTVRKTTGWDN